MKTLRIKVAAAIILGAIVLMILGVVTVVGIFSVLGINDRGVLPLVLAFFSLALLIFIAGILGGWFKFLGQMTQIELTTEMPIQVQPGPKVEKLYHIALKVGREKIIFMVPDAYRRELREFIASTLNKSAPV